MIISVNKEEIYYVETDSTEHSDYRRVGPNNWEQRMGESWESVYFEIDELEREFQEYVAKNRKWQLVKLDRRPY
jgi:hypothetical protein